MAKASREVETQGLALSTPSTKDASLSPIFLLAKQCHTLHQTVCIALRDITQKEASQNGIDRDAALGEIQDARSRFKAWATSIAALQEGHKQSSLDFRLREATEIRQRILNILESLAESLQGALLIASGVELNEKWEAGALSDSEEDEEKLDGRMEKEIVETSELAELFKTIKMEISSLMKLSVVIRNSPSRDDYLKAATRYNFDPRWDIGHVNEKFGSAKRNTKWLVERFGKSITRRRQYLMYRKEHHGKLSRDWGDEPLDNPEEDEKRTIAYTKATTFVENKPYFDKEGSEVGSFGSQTSYEQTIAGEPTEHRLTVPPPPKTAFEAVPFEFGKPFLCPYCFTEQTIKNKKDWKKHVFRDLRPYVCTFEECNLRMFGSRNEWFAHEMKIHRREWTCITCSKTFISKSIFQAHLSSTHYVGMAGSELEALVLQSEEPLDKIGPGACKFCDEWETNLRKSKHDEKRIFLNEGKNVEPYGTLVQFRRHLGRHMEQLALFALPMVEEEIIEESDDSDDGSNDLGEPQPLEDMSNSTDANPVSEPEPEIIAQEVVSGASFIESKEKEGKSGLDKVVVVEEPIPELEPAAEEDIGESLNTYAKRMAKQRQELDAERKAYERYNIEEAEKYIKAKKEKEDNEEEYQERLKNDLRKSGMDERQIEVVLKKGKGVDRNRPAFTRMSRRHLSIETLNTHRIEYEFDQDPDYVLIKRWVPEYEQDFLWKHTREIREHRRSEFVLTKEGSEREHRQGETEFEPVRKGKHKRKTSPSPLITFLAGGKQQKEI